MQAHVVEISKNFTNKIILNYTCTISFTEYVLVHNPC